MDENINELFWRATIAEVKKGYIEKEEYYQCIVCGETFTKGRIYPLDENWFDAKKMIELHIMDTHQSMLDYILKMNTNVTGITEIQKNLLDLLAKGYSDKEVSEQMGIHPSTVRNHKYRLREKEKQAKLFLAMMQLLEESQGRSIKVVGETKLEETPKTANMVDDRFDITTNEKDKILKTYFDETGRLRNYPSKEKRKIIVLEKISKHFSKGKIYKEVEVNRILKRIWEDHVALRRALIEYGFMERANDGKSYWVKE